VLKRVSHIILSVWLAVVLFFGSTPKEFIHLFTHHTDTVHSAHEKDGLVFDPIHHHCTFLSYALPLFVKDDAQPVFTYHEPLTYPQYHAIDVAGHTLAFTATAYLRGPPAI